MLIMIGAEKGGVGKSTITANMAVYMRSLGYTVAILDADPQGTLKKFVERRNALDDEVASNDINLVIPSEKNISPNDFIDMVYGLEGKNDFVFIDAGGRDSKELRTSLMIVDVLIIPTRPSQADLETLPDLEALIVQANIERNEQGMNKLQSYAVLSIAPTNPIISEIRQAREAFESLPEIVLCNTTIHDRKIYRDALLKGIGVSEADKHSPAKAEIHMLAQEIFELEE